MLRSTGWFYRKTLANISIHLEYCLQCYCQMESHVVDVIRLLFIIPGLNTISGSPIKHTITAQNVTQLGRESGNIYQLTFPRINVNLIYRDLRLAVLWIDWAATQQFIRYWKMRQVTRTVIFTDLDGTLLHPKTYSFEEALPALNRKTWITAERKS